MVRLLSLTRLRVVCSTKKIINTNIKVICKSYQRFIICFSNAVFIS